MSLYSSLTQVLAPFAAKINGLLTGWDGTRYNTPGEAVRQQIADLHVLIGDTPGTAIQASSVAYNDSNVAAELTAVNGRLREQQGIIAEAFSVQSTYDVGDYVTYNDSLYKCHTAIATAGAWDSTKWTEVKVTDEMKLAEGAIPYPTDSQGGKVYPQSDKIIKVKNDGTTEYEDIPVGDVKKNLLFDSTADDPTKTTVAITIQTAGEASTDEVQNLKNTITVLVGNGSLTTPSVGRLAIRSTNWLGYGANGYSIMLPVTPGHQYKFVAETPVSKEFDVFAAPGFDTTYTSAYSNIPNTEGAVKLTASDFTGGNNHIVDGVNRIVVPAGMNYLFVNLRFEPFLWDTSTQTLGAFKVYDYTENPVNAAYEDIVDNPVVGTNYSITYNLTGAASSNNAGTVSGGSTYQTTITAASGKLIESCSVVVGGTTYTPKDGVLSITGANSNIAINAVAETPSEDSYEGQYTIKEELIPSSLLAGKMNTPTGLSSAGAGKLLYTDGNGGVTISVPKDTIEVIQHNLEYVPVYSPEWASGYYYGPDGSYIQATTEQIWGQNFLGKVAAIPYDSMLTCSPGEKWRFNVPPLRRDSDSSYMPQILIFNANKSLIWSATHYTSESDGWYYVTVPEGGAYIATIYLGGQEWEAQRLGIPKYTKSHVLELVRASWNAMKRLPAPTLNTLSKGYICVGVDDGRSQYTEDLFNMFTNENIPYYWACIPQGLKTPTSGTAYRNNLYYARQCVENGGEMLVHNGGQITADNIDNYDKLYDYFIRTKDELETYGFNVRGIITAGGTGVIHSDVRVNKWTSTFYEYCDTMGFTMPYNFGRRDFAFTTQADLDTYVQNVCVNHGFQVFYCHKYESAEINSFNYLMTKLADYQRGVDYDFCTPGQLIDMLMPNHQ